jgi:hypothetical protein
MPDSRTLKDCQIPVFKSHPTPVNVSVRPESPADEVKKKFEGGLGQGVGGMRTVAVSSSDQVGQGCSCSIL